MKFYSFAPSQNCRRSLGVINHLKLTPEIIPVDLSKGEHHAPDFLALNGNAKVPVLVDGNVTLNESNAINVYLAEKSGDTQLWPSDPAKRADVNRWMCWQMAHFAPACDMLQWENVGKPFFGAGDPDPARVAEGEGLFRRFAAVLDKALEGRQFVTGDQLTLADFAIAANLTYAEPAKMPVVELRNIMGWNERMNGIEAWRKSSPF